MAWAVAMVVWGVPGRLEPVTWDWLRGVFADALDGVVVKLDQVNGVW